MSASVIDWDEMERLAASADVRDRAFASGVRRLRWASADPDDRARLRALDAQARVVALAIQAPVRGAISRGALRGSALRARIEQVAVEVRDHWMEEVLDIADPPLEEAGSGREMIAYVPSGIADVLCALDGTGLGPDGTFVDLGAGMGKVALLASLLTGAAARGIEIDGALVARSRRASRGLDLAVRIDEGDARTAPLAAADVYYLFVPFTGAVLADVMARLELVARTRRIQVCASALDPRRFPWLRPRSPATAPAATSGGSASAWLVVHES